MLAPPGARPDAAPPLRRRCRAQRDRRLEGGPGRGRRTLPPARAWRRCERYRRLGEGGADAGRRALRFRLLAVEVERSHHWRVGEAEQEDGAIAAVDVLMEGPGRHREHVLVLPV